MLFEKFQKNCIRSPVALQCPRSRAYLYSLIENSMNDKVWSMFVVLLTWAGFCPLIRSFSTSAYGPMRLRQVVRTSRYSVNCPSYSFKLQSQNSEDVKINCQIARLNAVAAKLRAEAAELEVCRTSFKKGRTELCICSRAS